MAAWDMILFESDCEYLRALAQLLRERYALRICPAQAAAEALAALEQEGAGMLAIRAATPGGVSLLRQAARLQAGVRLVAVTDVLTPNLIDEMQRLGAAILPAGTRDVQALAQALAHQALGAQQDSPGVEATPGALQARAAAHLHALGMPPHLRGYRYLVDAIAWAACRPALTQDMQHSIYEPVARLHGSTPSRVERAMRNAIEKMCDRCRADQLERVFGYSLDPERGKPPNSQLIAMIADRIRTLGE